MMEILRHAIYFVDWSIIWYFCALNSFYALLILLAVPEIWRHWQVARGEELARCLHREATPPISVLMPAFNMEATIEESVNAQLSLHYPHHEVIVINDGSTDRTLDVLKAAFDLYEVPPAVPLKIATQPVRAYYRSPSAPSLLVVDKRNGGKADALNAGLSASRFPLVVAVDADTLVDPDALARLVRPFLLGAPVVAAGGTIRVANGSRTEYARVVEPRVPRDFLAGVQVPEYLRAFLFGRLGWNRLGGNLIVSGAFGLFRKDHLLAIGGYTTDNVVEDLDLVVRLHRYLRERGEPYEIPFIPDPVAWTEVPSDLKTLGRQRDRWHRGLVNTMVEHRSVMFNPRYGRVGWILYPFFAIGEMMAPVIELIGYIATGLSLYLGIINIDFALLFLVVALGYQMTLTIWAVLLEEATFRAYPERGDFHRMLVYAFLEPFGYRQLTVFWRLRGFWNALRGATHWGVMQRRGFRSVRDAQA